MNNGLQLNDGETLILDCSPEDSLFYSSMCKGIIPVVIVLGIFGILYLIPPHIKMTASDIAFTHKIIMCILMTFLFYVGLLYLFFSVATPQFQYILTDQRCIIYSGFVGANKRVIPYNRIVNIKIRQGAIESLFKLSTVIIERQGEIHIRRGDIFAVSARIWIKGLSKNDAEEITKIVSKHITLKPEIQANN